MPCLIEFLELFALPSSVLGPVELLAFSRFAASLAGDTPAPGLASDSPLHSSGVGRTNSGFGSKGLTLPSLESWGASGWTSRLETSAGDCGTLLLPADFFFSCFDDFGSLCILICL